MHAKQALYQLRVSPSPGFLFGWLVTERALWPSPVGTSGEKPLGCSTVSFSRKPVAETTRPTPLHFSVQFLWLRTDLHSKWLWLTGRTSQTSEDLPGAVGVPRMARDGCNEMKARPTSPLRTQSGYKTSRPHSESCFQGLIHTKIL